MADVVARREPPDHRKRRRDGCHRDDDAHRARRHPAVEREQPDRPEHRREARPPHVRPRRRRAAHGDRDAERDEPERLRQRHHRQRRHDAALQPAEEVADAPGEAGSESERSGEHYSVRNRPRRGDRVELVRVVEDGRLGRARGAHVVVARDRVHELRRRADLFEHPQAEVHVAEQPPLLRRLEDRRRAELPRAADIVDERGREEQDRRGAADGAAPARGRSSRRRRCARAARPRTSGGRPASPDTCAAARRRARASTSVRSPSSWISAVRNSRNPSSSSASRRIAGAIASGSTPSAGSSVRTSSCSRSRNRSTRPSTRTASPSAKRASSSSTSFQTRASMRPLGSTSWSARYVAPFRVRSRSFFATA